MLVVVESVCMLAAPVGYTESAVEVEVAKV